MIHMLFGVKGPEAAAVNNNDLARPKRATPVAGDDSRANAA
jgi:hypothetical protein